MPWQPVDSSSMSSHVTTQL